MFWINEQLQKAKSRLSYVSLYPGQGEALSLSEFRYKAQASSVPSFAEFCLAHLYIHPRTRRNIHLEMFWQMSGKHIMIMLTLAVFLSCDCLEGKVIPQATRQQVSKNLIQRSHHLEPYVINDALNQRPLVTWLAKHPG